MKEFYHACGNGDESVALDYINKLTPDQLCVPDDFGGYTAFHYACRGSSVAVIKAFISKLNANELSICDNRGRTGFYLACYYDRFDVAEILSKVLTCDQLLIPDIDGNTGFHWAINISILKLFIATVPEVSRIKNLAGMTRLHLEAKGSIHRTLFLTGPKGCYSIEDLIDAFRHGYSHALDTITRN